MLVTVPDITIIHCHRHHHRPGVRLHPHPDHDGGGNDDDANGGDDGGSDGGCVGGGDDDDQPRWLTGDCLQEEMPQIALELGRGGSRWLDHRRH